MHVTHIRTTPYHAPRRTHAANSDPRPRSTPTTRLRTPVTSADAAPRRAAKHAQSPPRHSS
jgi:hypothetical protein